MVASNGDCALGHSSHATNTLHRFTQVYTGLHRFTQVYTGLHRFTQVYTGLHRFTQVDSSGLQEKVTGNTA